MIGVAQVMGMKPTLRSFFSGAAAWAKTSVAMPSGKNCAMAASAVEAPTAARKARRERSSGNSARTTAELDDARGARIGRCQGGGVVLAIRGVMAAVASTPPKGTIGVERVIEAHLVPPLLLSPKAIDAQGCLCADAELVNRKQPACQQLTLGKDRVTGAEWAREGTNDYDTLLLA